MAEEVVQTVRESPEIEAYRIGLLESAKSLADQGIDLPPQLGAEMTGLQRAAAEQQMAGLGSFLPYLEQAGQTLSGAGQMFGGVEEALRAGSGPVTSQMLESYMNPYQDAVQKEINRALTCKDHSKLRVR